MQNEIKAPVKMPVARDGQIIESYFGRQLRGLKSWGTLRPSDHIFRKGRWEMLFKVSKGYFWFQVEKENYYKMFDEEVEKTKQHIEAYKKLGDEILEEAKKGQYDAFKLVYMELAVYLEKMIIWQKNQWVLRNAREIEGNMNREQAAKEAVKYFEEEWWKDRESNRSFTEKGILKWIKESIKSAKDPANDFTEFQECQGYFELGDGVRRFNEDEYCALKKLKTSEAELKSFTVRLVQASFEDAFNKEERSTTTKHDENVFREFIGLPIY